jgi:hypothetical protein
MWLWEKLPYPPQSIEAGMNRVIRGVEEEEANMIMGW